MVTRHTGIVKHTGIIKHTGIVGHTGVVDNGGGVAELFFDSFTDTNGTLLTAHTPDNDPVGGGWLPLSSGRTMLETQNNKALASTAAFTTGQALVEVSKGDAYTVKATECDVSGSNDIVYIGMNIGTLNAAAQYQVLGTYDRLNNQIAFLIIEDFTFAVVDSIPYVGNEPSNASSFSFSVVKNGATIKLFDENNEEKLSYTSAFSNFANADMKYTQIQTYNTSQGKAGAIGAYDTTDPTEIS